MRLPSTVARNLYWANQRRRGRGAIRERLDVLMHNESLCAREMDDLQLVKLRRTLQHAYDTVPYYRRQFDERGVRPVDVDSLADLTRLPVLDRHVLTAERDALVSSKADPSATWNFSSGSTGVRAQFLQDDEFRGWMRAHQIRTYQWCAGWQLGDPFVLLWGSEIYWSLRSVADRFDNLLTNRREMNTFHLSERAVEQFVDQLVRYRPALVSTYSNAIMLVARELESRRTQVSGLRAVQATSEPLTPATRDLVARVLGCEVYDKYGSRETNIVSHESARHDGMLIQSENVVVEIVDDEGQPCAPGVSGRVLLTTLNNDSMPLIRYETSDVAAFLTKPGTHEGPFRRMSAVAGRLQDLIVVPGGGCVDAYFFSYLLMRLPAVRWFQVVQDEPEALTLRLFAPKLTADDQREIIDRVRHHCGFPFRIVFDRLDEMPESATGKFRLCINNLPDVPRVDDLIPRGSRP